jgi:arylsulfatase A-like enzyme
VAGNGYQGYNYKLNQTGKVVSYGSAEADYLTDVLSGLGNKFVSQPSSQPFVIEIATFAPHSPYTPAPRHKDAFPGLTYPRTPAFGSRPTSSDPAWLQALPALTDPEIKQIDKNFRKRAQSVQAIDEMIGKLQETLKAIGHHRDTYIFFSSDNGYHMGERSQRAGKQTAFDTDIRVPLIVTGPGVPKGVTIDKIAQNIDLCPTFAELAGTAPPPTVNGHSLVALLHGQSAADWRNVALIEHHDAAYDPNDPDVTSDNRQPPTYEALRSADRVYVKYANGETEYHDHKTDPYELTNTAASLSTAQIKLLGDTIEAIKNCHTDAACWAAQHVTTGP